MNVLNFNQFEVSDFCKCTLSAHVDTPTRALLIQRIFFNYYLVYLDNFIT